MRLPRRPHKIEPLQTLHAFYAPYFNVITVLGRAGPALRRLQNPSSGDLPVCDSKNHNPARPATGYARCPGIRHDRPDPCHIPVDPKNNFGWRGRRQTFALFFRCLLPAPSAWCPTAPGFETKRATNPASPIATI
jgi:hypothetical protein